MGSPQRSLYFQRSVVFSQVSGLRIRWNHTQLPSKNTFWQLPHVFEAQLIEILSYTQDLSLKFWNLVHVWNYKTLPVTCVKSFFSTSLSSLTEKGALFFFCFGKLYPRMVELDLTRKDPGWRIALCSEGWWSWCFLSAWQCAAGCQLAQQGVNLRSKIFPHNFFGTSFLKPSKWPKNIAGFCCRSCEVGLWNSPKDEWQEELWSNERVFVIQSEF